MNFSNRFLGFLILVWFILSSYLFYKYFFELKLTNITINSNVSGFSWSLINNKFNKTFFCFESKCTINNIPPFNYKLVIKKDWYINNRSNIDLSKINTLDLYLKKDIKLNKIITTNNLTNKQYTVNDVIYNGINNDNKYFYHKKLNKLYIHNKNNNNTINFDFVPKIHYIKNIWNKNLVIVSEFWSYNLNLNTKKIEYFSLFSDYIRNNNGYIWIINSSDKIRKKNFWFNNVSWNLIIFYDIDTKEKYIIEVFDFEISKISNALNNVYIENNNWETFELKWY